MPIDIEFLEKILKSEPPIDPGESISVEFFRRIGMIYDTSKVSALFKTFPREQRGVHFQCELWCQVCSTTFVRPLTKTKLLEALSQYKNPDRTGWRNKPVMCDPCTATADAEKAAQQSEASEKRAQAVEDRTGWFINTFLDTGKAWTTENKYWFRVLQEGFQWTDEGAVSAHICEMSYGDFLRTPYWLAIVQQMKYRAKFRCKLCGSSGLLNVHHRSYENHGRELQKQDDLIVLCQPCHQKFHKE